MKIEHCGFKLVDVDYDNRLIILEKNDKTERVRFSFEFWSDVNKYATKEWDWKTKTVVKDK